MHLELSLFTLDVLNFFSPTMNKPNTHNKIIGISSFQNRLKERFSSIGFYFESKVIEGSQKTKKSFFILQHFYQNLCFWGCVIFFSLSGYAVNSIFQWQHIFIRYTILMKHFSISISTCIWSTNFSEWLRGALNHKYSWHLME